jgi:hypothetical protein
MKKFMQGLMVLVAVLALGSVANADTAVYSVSVTGSQAIVYSDALPVSGWLDRITVSQTAGATCTVTVAQYAGTTAVDTYASLSALVGNKVVRTRVIGTGNTGTALAAATVDNSTLTNNVTTQLSANYERILLGGNTKVAVTAAAASPDNAVTVTLFFEPLKK